MDLNDDPRFLAIHEEIENRIKSGDEPGAFSIAYEYMQVLWQPVFPEQYKEAVMSDPAIQ